MPWEREELLTEKSFRTDLLKSVKCKECVGSQSLQKAKPRRDNTFQKCSRVPRVGTTGGAKVESFKDLEKFLS
jgi:hypothetical protein